MIKVDQPSMALNAVDVPGAHHMMWNTWTVAANETSGHILYWIASVVTGSPGGYLKMVILNCHGFYGTGSSGKSTGGFGLKLGQGIHRSDTKLFSKPKGKVANIWITACGTARISVPGTSGEGDGNLFCSEIAQNSGAYVVAATTHQVGDSSLPNGYIDDFEGLVVRYNPAGAVDWSKDYVRNFFDGLVNGWD
ncbi:MAG: hypothetical protein L0226_00090 [Acidobacteria bacterium]|nr:hypothetical protein [Acidobacteriota bacterium]MCI0590136.1 hypothetical protein [Gammaproteobacteria bacterium]